MALGLDLSQSDAKIARAREHLESLKRETDIVAANRYFYTPRVEDDESAYWCSIYLVPKPPDNPPKEYVLSIIFGDFIHNLRCALNYIVTALVEKSPGAALGNKHQFPIFETRDGYLKRVGDERSAVHGGMLAGVCYGLKEIWDLQPFHRDPKLAHFVKPGDDVIAAYPLFHLNRLSNADKHRLLARIVPKPEEIIIEEPSGGAIVETRMIHVPNWEPNVEYKVARILTKAGTSDVHFEAKVGVSVWFGTPSFPKGSPGYSISLVEAARMCETVDAIVDTFKRL
jgi:hypothetical protein